MHHRCVTLLKLNPYKVQDSESYRNKGGIVMKEGRTPNESLSLLDPTTFSEVMVNCLSAILLV